MGQTRDCPLRLRGNIKIAVHQLPLIKSQQNNTDFLEGYRPHPVIRKQVDIKKDFVKS